MNRLRQLLDEIPNKSYEDATRHRQRIGELRTRCVHTITWVKDAGLNKSDCPAYALGIPSKILIAPDRIILVEFFNSKLIQILETVPNPLDSGLVLYLCDDVPQHIGVMHGERVISKWAKSPVYNHGLLEVPASYGNEIRYCKKPPEQLITNQFIGFVRSHKRYIDCKEVFEVWVRECGYGSNSKTTS